jgi:hypothetical protein
VFFVGVMGVLFAFMIVFEFCGFNEKTLFLYLLCGFEGGCVLRTLEDGRFHQFSGIKGVCTVCVLKGVLVEKLEVW